MSFIVVIFISVVMISPFRLTGIKRYFVYARPIITDIFLWMTVAGCGEGTIVVMCFASIQKGDFEYCSRLLLRLTPIKIRFIARQPRTSQELRNPVGSVGSDVEVIKRIIEVMVYALHTNGVCIGSTANQHPVGDVDPGIGILRHSDISPVGIRHE
jgi:hypothetical protein